jgi:hypothetical protein
MHGPMNGPLVLQNGASGVSGIGLSPNTIVNENKRFGHARTGGFSLFFNLLLIKPALYSLDTYLDNTLVFCSGCETTIRT